VAQWSECYEVGPEDEQDMAHREAMDTGVRRSVGCCVFQEQMTTHAVSSLIN
jgi:hypothetical protein